MIARHDAAAILQAEDRHGFHVVPDVIQPALADAARAASASLESRTDGAKICTTTNPLALRQAFRELVTHPAVLDLRSRLLGADMICSSCTAITLRPGHDGLDWQVDYPYWSLQPPYPTWDLAAYALWMLDDFTEDNGATGIIRGSHRFGRPPDLRRDQWPVEAVVATGRRGSVLLAKGPSWHTARPNRSAAPRSAFMVSYLRAFCIPHTDLRGLCDSLSDPSSPERQLYGAEQFVSRPLDPRR